MLIYLDNCCFNRPYDNQSRVIVRLETEAKLDIQHAILTQQVHLAWSFMLDFENTANPHLNRKETIAEWKKLASINIPALENIRIYANQIKLWKL